MYGSRVSVKIRVGDRELDMQALALPNVVEGSDVLLGMDAIQFLGGVSVNANGKVHFGGCGGPKGDYRAGDDDASCHGTRPERTSDRQEVSLGALRSDQAEIVIDDVDFTAVFDGNEWSVRWKWKNSNPTLTNHRANYHVKPDLEPRFNEALDQWVAKGWLQAVENSEGTVEDEGGIVPLMAVHQPQKNKVRPVLDYRELNEYVESHTADSSVCEETLRSWRQKGEKLHLLDLKDAYLQIRVNPSLWKYQQVLHRGKRYYLTRLGFGLSCAPRIMSSIVRKVLSLDEKIAASTSHYIDDILIDSAQVSVESVAAHLLCYGLTTKEPESIENARVLGLQVFRPQPPDQLEWKRGNAFEPTVTDRQLTRRELFAVCGKLVGHFPVANWLRVACSYIKRMSGGKSWQDPIGANAQEMLEDLLERVRVADPVRGKWSPGPSSTWKEVNIWCDASSVALGAVLEIDGAVVEDAAWLRGKRDCEHINVAELESAIKGLNLALKWGVTVAKIITDSATVAGWVTSVLEQSHRVKTKGISEMLVRRRLGMIGKLALEYGIQLSIELVPSARNLSDQLTRVPQRWLQRARTALAAGADVRRAGQRAIDMVRLSHEQHHMGVDRTIDVCEAQTGQKISRSLAKQVVSQCEVCRSIDPASVRWERGSLEVSDNWVRLAIDVTHVANQLWLSVVDSGPSRFAIWRRLERESAACVAKTLGEIFNERGPPDEILTDNAASFRSAEVKNLCDSWGIETVFRAAHRPSGNGIAERNHRTIKRIVARSKVSVSRALFWYNATAKTRAGRSPAEVLGGAKWRFPPISNAHRSETSRIPEAGGPPPHHAFLPPSETSDTGSEDGTSGEESDDEDQDEETSEHRTDHGMAVGDQVFARPPGARCNTPWHRGEVTRICSPQTVEVDGTPRHVADLRLAPGFGSAYRQRLRRTNVNPAAYCDP